MELFVTCGPNLEVLLAQELAELGYANVVTGFRGVSLRDVGLEAVYRVNYMSRLASRVLIPLSRFYCKDSRSLYTSVFKMDWLKFFSRKETFAIDANVSHPELRNSLFAIQVTKDAICDQLRERTGDRPNIDIKNPDIQLNLFIHDNKAIVSLDTSGQPLHKRGYRLEGSEAPIQENLAAALLVLAGFQGSEIVCDPCCGSGTLLIEAALMASKVAPGFLRNHWGFMRMPEHSQELWLKVKGEADGLRCDLPKNTFFGCDINKAAVHACKVNLRAAGLHQSVQVVQSDIRDYTPPVLPNFVIMNPPYGRRLEEVDHLITLYRAIGDFMKRMTAKPARGFVCTGSLELSKEIGLAAKRRHVIDNGGIDVRLLEFDLY